MILNPTRVSSTKFHWVKASSEFFAEISDLGHSFRFGRVYDDAADQGLTLVSRYDSREIVFVVDRIDRDGLENEITGWHLSPVLPGDGGSIPFTILIAND